ncbi:glycoside hydrolase family 16 protein [Streptomyces sp. TRM 70361]|uniref:glycoside hydrolase family 16 protein n=1 Tax=Streptomyces sp. TRM 70361 TaxID=3116553 RepID=UPI002E7B1A95|nr:glycoside hydrolase family 16 protein [Streptomyces sp. TRM 70361]MEE1942149.1 glycoside hydrolase family 16 protein [Streptomyces sp. TRM 70361]
MPQPPQHSRKRRGVRSLRWLTAGAAAVTAGALLATTATAAPVTENWTGDSPHFSKTGASGGTTEVVSADGAEDGSALRLTLNARPGVGPWQGVEISSDDRTYQYGTYGTRIKTADCSGQGRVGVITGTFTYSGDHGDDNGNGLPDNDEIDVEVLCAQPHVVWLTLWTDYEESSNAVRKIARAIDMRTGKVLYNCYNEQLGGECVKEQPGENVPASIEPDPDFDSSAQFHTYMFDWQPDSVVFWTYDDDGDKKVLWDYRGPASRIPDKPGAFMQNVWHTNSWDPLDGPATQQPQVETSAYIDSTTLPR